MTPKAVDWSQEVSQADWIVQRLHDFAVDVGSVIPDGLPAYVRIQHGDARTGSLSPEETGALVSLLDPVTALDRCWSCLWEGYGWIRGGRSMVMLERPSRLRHGLRRLPLVGRLPVPAGSAVPGAVPSHVLAGPRVELPQRSYLLYRGPVATATAWLGHPYRQSPNLWWASDRTWVVASEIDLDWTYVGGSLALIGRVLDHPLLDASPASPTDRFVATTNGRGR